MKHHDDVGGDEDLRGVVEVLLPRVQYFQCRSRLEVAWDILGKKNWL